MGPHSGRNLLHGVEAALRGRLETEVTPQSQRAGRRGRRVCPCGALGVEERWFLEVVEGLFREEGQDQPEERCRGVADGSWCQPGDDRSEGDLGRRCDAMDRVERFLQAFPVEVNVPQLVPLSPLEDLEVRPAAQPS